MTDETVIDATEAFKSKDSGKAKDKLGSSIDKLMKKARLPRFSGAQMREHLETTLPNVKEARRERERAGRKHTYTRERFMGVILRMGAGETQTEALQAEGIASSTFQDWLERADGREEEALHCRNIHARAKLALADMAFNESLAAPRKLYELAMGKGDKDAPSLDSAMVGAVKLYSDSLRFYASRLNPAAYGEDKSAPVVNVTNNSLAIDGRTLDAGQREQLRALLTAAQHNHGNDSKLIDG
jgi:hypothetical protein